MNGDVAEGTAESERCAGVLKNRSRSTSKDLRLWVLQATQHTLIK